jgi:hypothetical protein
MTSREHIESVIKKPFDDELFDLARNDDYVRIYEVILGRLQTKIYGVPQNITDAHAEALGID